MKRSLKNLSRLLMVTGCVSLLAYNIANAAPLVYDVEQSAPEVRTNYTTPNKIRLEGDVAFNDHGQKITLSLRNTDVQQVLRMFADKAGLNIVFHDSVSGNVTLDLVDVTLSDALKMVTKMTNLTYIVKDKTMMVVPLDKAETINLTKDTVNILPVKYADAAYLAQFLNTNVFAMNAPGLSYGPIVSTNSDTNELLIFGTDADYQMAKKIVDKFDRKPLMTTYRVNHTTPFEMAKMICETLFQVPSSSGGSGSSSENNSTLKSEFQMGSAPTEPAEGTVGGGTVACTVNSSVSTKNISSYQPKPTLTIYVQQTLGTLTMVGGSEAQVQMVNDFILDNDRKQPQALLDISFISLTESGSKEFNNSFTYTNGRYTINALGTLASGVTANMQHRGAGLSAPEKSQFSQMITFLMSESKARLLSNPKVVVTNGQKSTIDLTQDYIKSTTLQVIQSGNGENAAPVTQKTYEIGNDNGIKVEIVPFISPDGYVSLSIKPEYASPYENIEDYDANARSQTGEDQKYIAATLLQRRNLDLKNIRVKDGETLILGGFISKSQDSTTSKIPILGDLPVIGFLFRSETKGDDMTELLISITPRIIKDTEDVADL